jgi:hypothetical protein
MNTCDKIPAKYNLIPPSTLGAQRVHRIFVHCHKKKIYSKKSEYITHASILAVAASLPT